jgi:hypothetical protein
LLIRPHDLGIRSGATTAILGAFPRLASVAADEN